jgi:hypothetical protein
VRTYGYRSYAHLFYSKEAPINDPRAYDDDWLIRGTIDRPVYLSAKVNHANEVEVFGTFNELYRKNGFVFYRRDP